MLFRSVHVFFRIESCLHASLLFTNQILSLPPSPPSLPPPHLSPCPLAACKDSKRALEVSQHAEDMGLILGACAGGLVVLILLLGAIVIVVKKG